MWGAMIGSAIAGLFAGLAKVYIYAFAGASSIVAIPCFIGPDSSNVIEMCIAIVIGIVATFVATFILYKDEEAAA
jgi:PTS system beta-glucosides-specific IIC component